MLESAGAATRDSRSTPPLEGHSTGTVRGATRQVVTRRSTGDALGDITALSEARHWPLADAWVRSVSSGLSAETTALERRAGRSAAPLDRSVPAAGYATPLGREAWIEAVRKWQRPERVGLATRRRRVSCE
jgi:hypothetical protein